MDEKTGASEATGAPEAPERKSRRFPAWLSWTLRGAVLVGLLAYILHGLDFAKVGTILSRLPVWAVLAGLALLLTGQALQAARWKVLLRESTVRYRDCFAFISVGATLNLVSPSGILSDGTIAYWMGKRNKMVIQSMSSLLASRLIGVFAMGLLFAIAFPSHLWVFGKLDLAWAPAKVLIIGMAVLSLAVAAVLARRHESRVRALLGQALPALKSPGSLLFALLLSVAVQLCQFAMLVIGYLVMEIPIGILDLFFFAPIMTFIGLIPMSIGGIGVREGLSIFFFTLLPGVEKEMLLAHAGYGYVLMAGMAAVNGLIALAVLGRPGPKT